MKFWPYSIHDDIKWFPFQSVMMHKENIMKIPTELLRSVLKVFSMLNMRVCYEKNTINKQVPDTLGIKCINCGKLVGCTLHNQQLEDFVTVFVTVWYFRILVYLGSSSKKTPVIFEYHCPNWISNRSW